MNSLQLGLTLAAALLAGACAAPGAGACRDADWRQLGFEDAMRGRAAEQVARHRETCAEHGISPDLDRYRDGHADGLARYCGEQNGFRIGREGSSYGGACPAELESRFLAAYQTGRRLHQLQTTSRQLRRDAGVKRAELRRLEPRAQNLERLLGAGGIAQREHDLLRHEFNLLQSNITRLRTDARVLELEAAKLEAEHERLDSSHRYR